MVAILAPRGESYGVNASLELTGFGGSTASGAYPVTRSLSPEQAARYQLWIDTDRRLRQLITELHQLAVDQAETTEGWPRT